MTKISNQLFPLDRIPGVHRSLFSDRKSTYFSIQLYAKTYLLSTQSCMLQRQTCTVSFWWFLLHFPPSSPPFCPSPPTSFVPPHRSFPPNCSLNQPHCWHWPCRVIIATATMMDFVAPFQSFWILFKRILFTVIYFSWAIENSYTLYITGLTESSGDLSPHSPHPAL